MVFQHTKDADEAHGHAAKTSSSLKPPTVGVRVVCSFLEVGKPSEEEVFVLHVPKHRTTSTAMLLRWILVEINRFCEVDGRSFQTLQNLKCTPTGTAPLKLSKQK